MSTTTVARRVATAEHRPAVKQRKYRHDSLTATDLFSGFGGLTQGLKDAGFDTIMAANHNAYKVEVHEKNHPEAEHWIADLINPEAADYHSARDLPAADLLAAGVTCTNHSQANTQRAYEQGMSLFDLDDPDYDARVTKSERDRATANCVLHYAEVHRPSFILVECTTELQSWGVAVHGKTKVGDGSTYRWWLKQFATLGYKHRVLYLNSMFFGVPQSRDRLYIVFWQSGVPTPDLDHRPASWCGRCSTVVEAVWTWRTGIPASGSVRYGKQYDYRCPSCRQIVLPPVTPSLAALDLSDLGTRIGDRKKPLAASTMARAEKCRQRFAEFPAVVMPAKAAYGSERTLLQPLGTQTSQQEAALLSTGQKPLLALGVDNFQGAARGANEPLPTQVGSETLGLVSGVLPFRKNTVPTLGHESMPTVTAEQIPGVLSAHVKPGAKAGPQADDTTVLFGSHIKQNGSTGDETGAHPLTDPLGTLTARDTTGLVTATADWQQALADLSLEDCYFRMMQAHEVGRGCGFDVPFGAHPGTFEVWGSARDQVDGFGNAVSPAVGQWIGERLRQAMHGADIGL